MMMDKRQQWLILGLLGLAVLAGLYYGVLAFVRRDSGEVMIDVLPTHATVTIDGKKAGQGSQFLSEGKHKIDISASGFVTSSRTVEVSKDSKQTLLDSLAPANSEGEKWISDHEKLYAEYEEKGGAAALEEGLEVRKQFPIIALLPYDETGFTEEYSGFTIGYKAPKNGVLTLTIHAKTSLDRQLALSKIKGWGYNPANFAVEFSDFAYPLSAQSKQEEQ